MAEVDPAIAQAETLIRKGRFREALQAAERVLEQDGLNSRALVVEVNAANAIGDLDRLIGALERLLRRHPLHAQFTRMLATAINNRGSRSIRTGGRDEALIDFEKAIALWPEHPQAWFNLGCCLHMLGRLDAARHALGRHLALQPQDQAAALLLASLAPGDEARAALQAMSPSARAAMDAGWLAHTAAKAGLVSEVLTAMQGLTAESDLDMATEALCELRLRGEVDPAITAAGMVASNLRRAGRPCLRAELIGALTLPAIYPSQSDLLAHRTRFDQGLSLLEQDWDEQRLKQMKPRLRELSHSNFLLAYQGLLDKEQQLRFARLIERAARAARPDLASPPPASGSGRRVGLLSACWRRCTVGAYFGGWVRWLREAGLEVYLYQIGPQRDAHTDRLGEQASVFRFLQGSIESIAETVRADGLDLLIYPEIGMDARLTPLAALRLARRQALAWGHPTTSGFEAMDAYFSCASMEPDHAQAHYVEPLLTLPGIGVDYDRPALPPPAEPEAFGLDPQRPRVLVPQSLFKLHPDTDQVLAGLAEQLPDAQLVMFEPEFASWREQYTARLGTAFADKGLDASRHLVFLPILSRPAYLQVNMACDVMLDSLHWSGGNTAVDALSCNLLPVACPGALMRGRQSHAMLSLLGLEEDLSCASPAEQLTRTVQLASDGERRRDLQSVLAARLESLFEASMARRCFLEQVESLLHH